MAKFISLYLGGAFRTVMNKVDQKGYSYHFEVFLSIFNILYRSCFIRQSIHWFQIQGVLISTISTEDIFLSDDLWKSYYSYTVFD